MNDQLLIAAAIAVGIVIILINGFSLFQQRKRNPGWLRRDEVGKITGVGSVIFAILLALASII